MYADWRRGRGEERNDALSLRKVGGCISLVQVEMGDV